MPAAQYPEIFGYRVELMQTMHRDLLAACRKLGVDTAQLCASEETIIDECLLLMSVILTQYELQNKETT